MLSELHRLSLEAPSKQEVVDSWRRLGEELYRLLFDEDARKELRRTAPAPLLLEVRDSRLALLPWEVIHDGEKWLALDRDIIRLFKTENPLPDTGAAAADSEPVKGSRAEVCALLSSPMEYPESPVVSRRHSPDVSAAGNVLQQLHGMRGAVHIAVQRHATLNDLMSGLSHKPDILYLHGCGGRGWIGLEDRYGRLDVIRDRALGDTLRNLAGDHPKLAIVEFPSDGIGSGGSSVSIGPERRALHIRAVGMARTLLEMGVPASILLRAPLPEDAKARFLQRLFSFLAEGKQVNEAVRSARLQLAGEGAPPSQWAAFEVMMHPDMLDCDQPPLSAASSCADPRIEVMGLSRTVPGVFRRDAPFVGRQSERIRMIRILDSSEPAVSLVGPAGSGKSSLTALVASHVSRWFDDVAFVRLGEIQSDAEDVQSDPGSGALNFLARAVGLRPDPTDTVNRLLTRLQRHLATGRRRLLVIDNPLPEHREVLHQVLEDLPACCKVIVNCREKLCNSGKVVTLGPMSNEEIAAVIRNHRPDSGGDTAHRQWSEEAIKALVPATGGNPLAAKLLAGIVSSQGLEVGEDDESVPLPKLAASAIEAAPEEAINMWEIASAFEPAARRDVLKRFYDDTESFTKALTLAVDAGLVDTCAYGRFVVVNPLLKHHGRWKLDDRPQRSPGAVRAALHLLSLCQAAGALALGASRVSSEGNVDLDESLTHLAERLLQAEQQNLIRALSWLETAGQWRDLSHYARRMHSLFHRYGYWPVGMACSRTALAAAHRVGDPLGEARARFRQAVALGAVGLLDEAGEQGYFALEELSEHGAGKSELMTVRRQLGEFARRRNDRMATLWHYQAALDLSHEITDASAEAAVCLDLATIARQNGDYEAAEELFKRRLAIETDAGRLNEAAATMRMLAAVTHEKGDTDAAVDWCKQRITLYEEIGDTEGLLNARRALAALAQIAGKDEDATEVLDKIPAIGSRENARGTNQLTVPHHQPPLSSPEYGFPESGDSDPLSAAFYLPELATAVAEDTRPDDAARLCEQAAELLRRLDRPNMATLALRAQAEQVFKMGHTNEAVELLNKSADLCRECGDTQGAAEAHCRAGAMSFMMNEEVSCRDHLCEALRAGLDPANSGRHHGETPLTRALNTIVSVGRSVGPSHPHAAEQRKKFSRMIADFRNAVGTFNDESTKDPASPSKWAQDVSGRILDGLRTAIEAGEPDSPEARDAIEDARRQAWAIEQSIGHIGLSSWLDQLSQRRD